MPFLKIKRLSFLFFLWINLAFAQNFPSKNYSANTVLPNNAVRSLLIDSDDNLWIGTENGIVKKENDAFSYFFEEDGLALNSCWAIAEDSENRLWFGSYGNGLSIYDGSEFRNISEENGLIHNEITKLFSHGKTMYVGTSDGVSMIDIHSFEIKSFKENPGNQLFRVTGFFENAEEIYVVTYNTGLYKISEKNGAHFLTQVNDQRFNYSIFKDGDSIYNSNKGFYTKTPISNYIDEAGPTTSEEYGHSILWDYSKTKLNRTFAAAWGIFDNSGGIYEIVANQLISRTKDFNIRSEEVIALAYDPEFEKLYVGTKDEGLFEVQLDAPVEFHQFQDADVIGFSKTANTEAILLSDGILIKNASEKFKVNLKQLKSKQQEYVTNGNYLPKYEDSFYELNYETKAENIGFYDLKSFKNEYWLNTNIGIFTIDEFGTIQNYIPLHSEEINFTATGELIETHPYGGVRVYNATEDLDYTYFDPQKDVVPTLVVNSIRHADKTYFLSIFSGLYTWENGRFTSYIKEGIWNEKKLKHVTTFGEDLAISNEFGDIFIVNDDKSFRISEKIPRAAIEGNSISFLNEFNGSLIIGTEKGLNIYQNGRFIFLDEEQGLKQPFFTAVMEDDQLLIGSENGYFSIDPEVILNSENLIDRVEIQEILVNNSKLVNDRLDGEHLKLQHNENTILVQFKTNAHPYPNKLTYQYRIAENDLWSSVSEKPEILLPFLPPKNYKIQVKVTDRSTGETFSDSILNLTITPPFWKTWWFISLIILLIFIGIFSFYQFKINQERKYEKQKRVIERRFEETKMEALLAQMNPHFIFNAMNSIQNYIMDSDIDKATAYLGDFARLIRLNLDHCTKQHILLTEEIEYLQAYIRVENTRLKNAVDVQMEVDPEIDPYDVEIPAMLLQTFVENVFVHAFPPKVKDPVLKISFRLLSPHTLECRVADNGVGIDSTAGNSLHQSKGLNLVKERLALLGYDTENAIQINALQPGTEVILKLKI